EQLRVVSKYRAQALQLAGTATSKASVVGVLSPALVEFGDGTRNPLGCRHSVGGRGVRSSHLRTSRVPRGSQSERASTPALPRKKEPRQWPGLDWGPHVGCFLGSLAGRDSQSCRVSRRPDGPPRGPNAQRTDD